MASDLALRSSHAIEPQSFADLRALAKDAAASRFFGCDTPEQALLVMMAGRDLGLSYTQSLRAFHIVKGRPCLSSQGMVGVCLTSPLCKYFRTVQVSDTEAIVETQRGEDPPRQARFTLEEARKAGLAQKDNWKAYPSRMLLARAQAFLAREVYPDLLMGLYDPDELDTLPRAPRPVRPVEVVATTLAPTLGPVEEWTSHMLARLEAATELAEVDEIAQHIKAYGKEHPLAPALRATLAEAYKTAAARAVKMKASEPHEAA